MREPASDEGYEELRRALSEAHDLSDTSEPRTPRSPEPDEAHNLEADDLPFDLHASAGPLPREEATPE